MENQDAIPADIRRFILTSIDSVPHLEAILLLCCDPKTPWDAKMMAQSLYISEKKAEEILGNLAASGFTTPTSQETPATYQFKPASPALQEILTRLRDIYAKNLVEVTNLIHSKTSKQAQELGDAFKWQKEG
jgi:hypothetical protein